MEEKKRSQDLENWLALTLRYRRKEREMEQRVAQVSGLCLNEYYLLYLLSNRAEKKIRLQDAQELIQMSQSALSRLVKRLEESMEEPLVGRSICNKDRRGVYIRLTEAGQDLCDIVTEEIRGIVEGAAEDICR